MQRRRLLWHLFPSYLLITALAMAAVSWYAGISLRSFYYSQTISTLEARAKLLEARVGGSLSPDQADTLQAIVADLGGRSGTRITVVLPTGRVVADSDERPSNMENHADRPEIALALTGEVGTSRRFSHTLGKELVYVAVPVVRSGNVVGAVRTALPRTALDRELGAVLGRIALAAALLLLLAAGISLVVSRRLTGPIEEMKIAAQNFARGDLKHSIQPPSTEELAGLAESLNAMATELDAQIHTITQQRAEQEAVLASMAEGVVAVDPSERVIAVNRAASSMLGIEPENVRGRPVQEVIRNTGIHKLVAASLESETPVEREFVLTSGPEMFVQARGTALRDEYGNRAGAVVVLNDMTRMRRLENMRRDFVANVSHELRTPVTSIKGFVETLMDGSDKDPADTARFMAIVSKHADRLNAIIEDLLFLSRIEQGPSQDDAIFDVVEMDRIVDSVIENFSPAAAERRMDIVKNCAAGISTRASAQLLEHALGNILDNAIKYSQEGSSIRVSCSRDGEGVVMEVRDEGIGIPASDLPRIFERFYRVDKARSREMGGTGLGLAIAKHIVQAHGGRITVESEPGVGSTFTVHMPAA